MNKEDLTKALPETLHVGDGFLYDGVKLLRVAPSMEVHAVINLNKQCQNLARCLHRYVKADTRLARRKAAILAKDALEQYEKSKL